MSTSDFYDAMTPFYHLIYPNWEESISRQAALLGTIIHDYWGEAVHTILDVSCGIGTQSLGLAQLGYQLTASDLSAASISRAKAEAQKRHLAIRFSVADMRQAFRHHAQPFDLVISCDNAVPHLLSDDDIRQALQQFYQCIRPGGGSLISVRPYEQETRTGVEVLPYGVRDDQGARYLVFQVREWHGSHYDIAMYFVEDRGGTACTAQVTRGQYYAVPIDRLLTLMREAGFVDVQCLDDRYVQPLLMGRKSEA